MLFAIHVLTEDEIRFIEFIMDKLINAGKEFLEERNQQGQGHGHGQGQEAYGGNYPAGGGFSGRGDDDDDDDDFRTAQEEAAARAGSSGSSDLFSSILGSIGQKKTQIRNEDIDEDDAVKKHKKTYDDDDDDADEDSLGTAAALQALKLFNKGETGQKQSQGAFIGLALSEASKLFDDKAAKGKVSSNASKESTIQKAGEVAMKMYFKSQGQQQGGLLSMASKFL
ncbi:hypothetical protein HJFPF1_01149 [Paramyrothecium foliicola]|nr:hypothetical protein HJFPF1_01149 [Paramyrothecium foliicola]